MRYCTDSGIRRRSGCCYLSSKLAMDAETWPVDTSVLSVLILVSSMAQCPCIRLYSPDVNRSSDIAGSCGGVARNGTVVSSRVAQRPSGRWNFSLATWRLMKHGGIAKRQPCLARIENGKDVWFLR